MGGPATQYQAGGSAPKAFVWYQLVDNKGGNVSLPCSGPNGATPIYKDLSSSKKRDLLLDLEDTKRLKGQFQIQPPSLLMLVWMKHIFHMQGTSVRQYYLVSTNKQMHNTFFCNDQIP